MSVFYDAIPPHPPNPAACLPPPFPPPVFQMAGLVITATDYKESPWQAHDLPYLHTYRGVLQVMLPMGWQGIVKNHFHSPFIITRGRLACGCEALELFFQATDSHLIIPAHHANRLPGDPAGKRAWDLEFWLPWDPPGKVKEDIAFWRSAPRLPWLKKIHDRMPERNQPRKDRLRPADLTNPRRKG